MDYQIVTVYSAHTTVNEWGALGGTIGYYTSKSTAEHMAQGKGWYGGQGAVRERKALKMSDGKYYLLDDCQYGHLDIDDQEKKAQEKIKADALAKLNDDEKRILGLK